MPLHLRVFVVVLLACFTLPLLGASGELVFVFSAQARQVEVFSADDLTLRAGLNLAHPPLAGFSDFTSGSTYYFIVTTKQVVVVDQDWTVERTLDLPAAVSSGSTPAALAAGRLAVVAGSQLVVVDTSSRQIEVIVELPQAATDVVADRAGNFLLSARNSAAIQTVDAVSLKLKPNVGILPTAPTALSFDPLNGRLYAASRGALHAINELPDFPIAGMSQLSRPAKPQAGRPIDGYVITPAGRYYMLSGNRVFFGLMEKFGEQRELMDPRNGLRFSDTLTAIAPNSYGDKVFVTIEGSDTLVVASPNSPGEFQSAALSAAPSGVAVVSPRAQTAGSLSLITLNNETVAGGQELEIVVEALNDSGLPVSELGVFASNIFPDDVVESCLSGVSGPDGRATIRCQSLEGTQTRSAQITLTSADGNSAPIFQATIVPPTEGDGIFIVDGDGRRVAVEAEFSITVLVSQDRLRKAGVILLVTVEEGDPATCPPVVQTGEDGQAVITCTSGLVAGPRFADITVTVEDTGDAVDFRVSVDPSTPMSNGLTKVSGDNQTTLQGNGFPLPLVVSSFLDGEPRRNVRMNALTLQLQPIECPVFIFTDDEGLSSFMCRAKNLMPSPGGLPPRTAVEVRVADIGRRLRDPFILFVSTQGASVANDIEVLTSTNLDDLLLNTVHTDAIKVRANSSGQPSPNTPVYFWSDETDVTIDPVMATTNAFGEASTSISVGCTFQGRAKFFIGLDPDDSAASVSFNGDFGPLAELEIIRGNDQKGVPRQRLDRDALVVRTVDACGSHIELQPVKWKVNPEHMATLELVVSVSDGSARASAIARLRDHGGPFTVTASSGELVATFNLETLLEPTQFRKRAGDGQTVGANQFTPTPLITEVFGNNGFGVGGVPVNFAVTQGLATLTTPNTVTDAVGLAFTRIRIGGSGGPVVVEARSVDKVERFFINGGGGPLVTLQGFVDGASFQPGLIPDSLASIFGVNIVESEGIFSANAVPFPTILEGVSVTINGTAVPIVSIANVNGLEQINLQVPFDTAIGNAQVAINNNGASASFEGVPIVRKKPSIFEFNVGAQRVAAALHADFRPVTPSDPALPGEVILLFLTGLGATTPSVATNARGPSSPLAVVGGSIAVGIDNAGMEHFGAFYAPGLITAYQINFRVGQNVAAGLRDLNVVCDGVGSLAVKIPIGAI